MVKQLCMAHLDDGAEKKPAGRQACQVVGRSGMPGFMNNNDGRRRRRRRWSKWRKGVKLKHIPGRP